MLTLFKPWRAKKFCNNPLHLAVLENNLALLKTHSSEEAYRKEKNSLGFTPQELVYFFNRESFLPFFSQNSLPLPPVEKEGKVMNYSKEEFENQFGVSYLHHLEFENFSTLAWVSKQCQKALEKNIITTQQKWLGSYYQKEMAIGFLPSILIRWIDSDIGFGVFAQKNFRSKDYIGEYTGLLRKKKTRADLKNSYCFEYLIGETEDTPYTIDAQDKGNFTRFINHSAEGNCDPMIIFSEGFMRVIIYANRDIAKGSQITYDYGPDYWAKRESPEPIQDSNTKEPKNV